MRLFLASYRFGAHQDSFLDLLGAPPGTVAVIANAADAWAPAARVSAVVSDSVALRRLGFAPHEVDLRDYVDDPDGLAAALADVPVVWARGGNTFVLRAQLARSGGDEVLRALLADDRLMYAGYSAGACVMTPTLHGLETFDAPTEVAATCGIDPIWDGLGLVDRPIVPHVDSPLDDARAVAAAVDRMRAAGLVWPLRDDQVVVVRDGVARVLS